MFEQLYLVRQCKKQLVTHSLDICVFLAIFMAHIHDGSIDQALNFG